MCVCVLFPLCSTTKWNFILLCWRKKKEERYRMLSAAIHALCFNNFMEDTPITFGCLWPKTEPEQNKSPRKKKNMLYHIKKKRRKNGNQCTELEGGLNATHRHNNSKMLLSSFRSGFRKRITKRKLPKFTENEANWNSTFQMNKMNFVHFYSIWDRKHCANSVSK